MRRMQLKEMMNLHSFLIIFSFISFGTSSSTSFGTTHKCSAEQTVALILFKENLSSINFSIDDPPYYSPCQDWLGSDYYPLMMTWNKNRDCCKWDGVTCDHFTGDVIGIDLSCGMLRGTIHPNATLFNLPRLQRLNLAYNDFTASQFPREVGRFSSSLTHLNISQCGFTSEITSEISFLPKLVSLDLSSRGLGFRIQPHVFLNLLQNSTVMKELSLGGVNISSSLPTYLNISSSMELLNLGNTRLEGKLPHNIFNLRSLEKLDLSDNSFTGQIPSGISLLPKLISLDLSLGLSSYNNLELQPYAANDLLQNSTLLRELSLSQINIGWVLPTYLNSTSLKFLDISYTGLQGKLPHNIFNLQHLEVLRLRGNSNLTGPLPNVNKSTSIPLKELDLSNTGLSGEVLDSVGHFESLSYLDLSSCGLVGSLPKSLANLRELTFLLLSSNMLNGTLPSWLFTPPSLEIVWLDRNMFSGNLPLELYSLQSLRQLDLSYNQFDGQIDVLDQGPTHQIFKKLINLISLDLSFNNFRGNWELDTLLSSLINIGELYLSYSGLSIITNNATDNVTPDVGRLGLAACNLTVFPGSLRAMKNLRFLDLSSNNIRGHIPHWAGEIGGNGLLYLNLSHNFITGLPQFLWPGLQFLHLKSNLIQGKFPPSVCNMSLLVRLDISDNNFVGMIPQCLGNISSILRMVDMGNNHFHGTIPDVYEDCGLLEGLVLNGNQLVGEVPSSLSKCLSLKVLDLGENHLNGTFPNWLEDLPNLQALVLKSNNLHGPIVASSQVKLPFPALQVLDISNNGFVGHLPRIYLQNFIAMKDVERKGPKPQYLNISGLYYSIIVEVKGRALPFTQILVDYTIVNLSNNKFEGEIPDVIGGLTSLIVLDLSHNILTGRIPDALGNILEIQSLDLSWNQLTGEIPQSLVDLTFLAFLNLSQNHLVGRIPSGRQFDTFEGNSFGGNRELCGLPLSKKCELPHEPQLEDDEDNEDWESGFTWRVVLLGYGCGTLLGLVMGYLMLSTGKPKWFNAIADAMEHMIQTRQNKRNIGSRN